MLARFDWMLYSQACKLASSHHLPKPVRDEHTTHCMSCSTASAGTALSSYGKAAALRPWRRNGDIWCHTLFPGEAHSFGFICFGAV